MVLSLGLHGVTGRHQTRQPYKCAGKWGAEVLHSLALQVDNRMRAWYLGNMAMGLLYTCSLGDIQADAPVALVQNRRQNGADVMEVVPMDHQLPGQREQACSLTCLPVQHVLDPVATNLLLSAGAGHTWSFMWALLDSRQQRHVGP